MSEKIKAISFFLFMALILTALFWLNFNHIQIQNRLFLPDYLIPAVTFLGVVIVLLSFWNRGKILAENEYEFLTIITHKFRTPLVSIRWVMDELRKDNIPHAEKNELMKNTQNSVEKLMEVVDNLAGIARSDSRLKYSFEPAYIRQMVDFSLEKFSRYIREKELNFKIGDDPNIPVVLADFHKIQFVIDTLFENAIKYTPEGGTIYVKLSLKGDSIILAVQDTGIGISRSDKRKIFRKFYRSESSKNVDPEGLGLALYMSKIIMDNHKGRLWAESDGEGMGSTFFMKLKI